MQRNGGGFLPPSSPSVSRRTLSFAQSNAPPPNMLVFDSRLPLRSLSRRRLQPLARHLRFSIYLHLCDVFKLFVVLCFSHISSPLPPLLCAVRA